MTVTNSTQQKGLLSPLDIPAAERLIFALDVPTVQEAEHFVALLGDSVTMYKLGLELFVTGGYLDLVKKLKDRGKKVFIDLKLFDVPETVGRAVRQLRSFGADFVTVHGNDGILAAAVREKGDTKVLAVTALTSLDDHDLADLGFQVSVQELVESRARRALQLGCDGVISSGLEAPMLRREHGDRLIIVTPGIRPLANVDDQKRTVPLKVAFEGGADYVVVGRPIRQASDPRRQAKTYQAKIAQIFSSFQGRK